jgi:hypothetical protein
MPTSNRRLTIRIIAVDDSCTESPTCPAQIKVDEDPDRTYFIVNADVADDIRAALTQRVGPGEVLGWVPNHVAAGR